MSARRWRALLALLMLLVASCGDETWHAKNVRGVISDLAFEMTDDAGRTVHAADYRGEVVLLFFGYTHCPDVCPTTLARLAQAIQLMGAEGRKVRILFVTVDPARDPPALLRGYVRAFSPQAIGLRGSQAQLDALTKRYRVAYSHDAPDAHGNYAVSHSSAVFAFDAEGRARLVIASALGAQEIATDLKRLVEAR
ncbi:MAG: SCO family protein [Burkholderiales bacterium]